MARIVREAGGRVRTNVFLRDMNLAGIRLDDGRRIEVLTDGLPLYHGRQLAIDTTFISALCGNGNPHPLACSVDGICLQRARGRKEATYPEFHDRGARAKLVVIALEVGGRWSSEAMQFISGLAQARARQDPPMFRKASAFSWRRRWVSLLSVAAHRAFAASLLGLPESLGADGALAATSEVVEDARYDLGVV